MASEVVARANGADGTVALLSEMGFKGKRDQGYNPDSIRHWPAGRRSPDPVALIALAMRLGISLDAIMRAAITAELVERERAS